MNPFAAVLLIGRRLAVLDPSHVRIEDGPALAAAETAGLALYLTGFLLMAPALTALGRNYQLGGCAPRAGDELIGTGPYRLVRHPMYAAALSISSGLALLVQSAAALGVFCVYMVLITALIPVEEEALRGVYGDSYVAVQRRTRRLIPFVY